MRPKEVIQKQIDEIREQLLDLEAELNGVPEFSTNPVQEKLCNQLFYGTGEEPFSGLENADDIYDIANYIAAMTKLIAYMKKENKRYCESLNQDMDAYIECAMKDWEGHDEATDEFKLK